MDYSGLCFKIEKANFNELIETNRSQPPSCVVVSANSCAPIGPYKHSCALIGPYKLVPSAAAAHWLIEFSYCEKLKVGLSLHCALHFQSRSSKAALNIVID